MSLPHGAPAPNEPPLPEPVRPPERPYPEAPLASRKALGEHIRELDEATTAAGVTDEKVSALADPKPPPRYIDPEVLRAFHDGQPDCISCGYYRVSAHHLVPRSRSGDDVPANLIPLCGLCHGCLHSGGKWQAYGVSRTADQVRACIGRSLTNENVRYVKAKLGTGAAAFLEKYGVEDE